MTQKIAVAVIHGIGKQPPTFADEVIQALQDRCRSQCSSDIVIKSVYWAPVTDADETALWGKLQAGGSLHFAVARRFLIDFLGNSFAYQISPKDRVIYDQIHAIFAQTLHDLADLAGATAPLCVIAHSLGSVIASNFLYDLQAPPEKELISDPVRHAMSATPLGRGETLALFYTLGSPLALWSLRYADFGTPIVVPAPQLQDYYPALGGEWINFYDPDDVIGSPLKSLNPHYGQQVTEDRPVNVGPPIINATPFSHLAYWLDRSVLDPIADQLVAVWRTVNS